MKAAERILARLTAPMHKHQIAAVCHMAPRTANVHLTRLHKARQIHVKEYTRIGEAGGAWTRVWALGPGKDARQPVALTAIEKRRKRRQDPEVCIKEMMAKRAKRFKEKHHG